MKQAAHRARHPFGQIPTYEEEGLVLFESGATVFHVAERHPGPTGGLRGRRARLKRLEKARDRVDFRRAMRMKTMHGPKLVLLMLAGAALGGGQALAQSAAAGAAPLASTWMADARTGCKVWDPQPEPDEGVRWSGACKDGFASGPGVTEWIEHGLVTERTEGVRVAGHLQGRGVQTLANGDRFEGSWKDDRKDGRGSYAAAAGWTYTGEFKADRFDGMGVLTDGKGGRYEGAWKAGRRNGQGSYTGADGTRFTGVWVDDEPVGGPQSAL
jgi:hypothetical protein